MKTDNLAGSTLVELSAEEMSNIHGGLDLTAIAAFISAIVAAFGAFVAHMEAFAGSVIDLLDSFADVLSEVSNVYGIQPQE